MKNKLPCELVRDLFPSYIDKLTSDVTNQLVEEHVSDCADCKEALSAMREPDTAQEDMQEEIRGKEIDYLKKMRRRTRGVVIGSVLAVVVLFLCLWVGRVFVVGEKVGDGVVYCRAQVQGNVLDVTATMVDSARVPQDIYFTEEEPGVINVSCKAVLCTPWNNCGVMTSEYTSAADIKQVKMGDTILWADGEDILAITSSVYRTRHPYVGDMSANALPVAALNMGSYLGGFANELQTEKEPYGWSFVLSGEQEEEHVALKEAMMKSYAYVLLAVVENLGEVSYEYEVAGKESKLVVTVEDASEFAGHDIKECYDDIVLLQRLIQKTGLDGYAFMDAEEALALQQMEHAREEAKRMEDVKLQLHEVTSAQQQVMLEAEFQRQLEEGKEINVKIVNNTGADISMMGISYSLGDEHKGTQAGGCADEDRAIRPGDSMTFAFYPLDFELSDWQNNAEIVLKAEVYDEENNAFLVEPEFKIAAKEGAVYTYILSGSAADGYVIEQ